MYFLFRGELIDISIVIDDVKNLSSDTFYHCGIYEAFNGIMNKCLKNGECSMSTIISNISNHYIQLIKLGESMMNLIFSNEVWHAINSPTELYDLTIEIGSDLGEIIVAVFNL